MNVGILHPGDMGSAIGRVLAQTGHTVLWCSDGRSAETKARAEADGLVDVNTVSAISERCEVILSVCPPHAAAEVAEAVAGARGLFVDCNAIASTTVREIERSFSGVGRRGFVDGGIIGPPPTTVGTTRLYLSGDHAVEVAEMFAGSVVDARMIDGGIGAASALKMAYAAWTKGSAALLLAARTLAEQDGVGAALVEEWRLSTPDLPERLGPAARSAATKGWRWVGEMQEIARSMAGADLPGGFHEAAAEIFRRTAAADAAQSDTDWAGVVIRQLASDSVIHDVRR